MKNKVEISERTREIILKLQQTEITEHAIYMNLSKRVKKQSDREILQRIAKRGKAHSDLWSKYTNKSLKPQKFKSHYIFINEHNLWIYLCY